MAYSIRSRFLTLAQITFGVDGVSTLFGHSVFANDLVTINQGTGVASGAICGALTTGMFDLAGYRPIIDVKPGSDPSCFNINGHGTVPVAIFGSSSLDVTDIDTNTLDFGGMLVVTKKGKVKCSVEDADGDGIDDLTCHFEDDDSFTEDSPGTGCVTGDFNDGAAFKFCNDICLSGTGN